MATIHSSVVKIDTLFVFLKEIHNNKTITHQSELNLKIRLGSSFAKNQSTTKTKLYNF